MTPCPEGMFPHTIRSGDTLWLLSQRYSTTISAIMAANPGLRPNNLTVGKTICIPTGRVPRPPVPRPPSPPSGGPPGGRCPVGLRTYTIQRNDTLWLLAQRYCTTVDTIRAINPGMDPNNLAVGQMIWIPAGYSLQNLPSWFRSQEVDSDDEFDSGQIPSCPEAYSYTIEAGDTLWLLSRRFQTTVEEIMAMNPGINPAGLFVGQVICIPRRQSNVSQPPMPMP
ncbi:MAG: LysM peptidoglycan-binding domain-containing protein [Lacrimispora sp.]